MACYEVQLNYTLYDLCTFEESMSTRYQKYTNCILNPDTNILKLFFNETVSESELNDITTYINNYNNPESVKDIKVINAIITNGTVCNECYTVCSEITYVGTSGFHIKECVVSSWMTPDTPNDSELEDFKYYIRVMDITENTCLGSVEKNNCLSEDVHIPLTFPSEHEDTTCVHLFDLQIKKGEIGSYISISRCYFVKEQN